MASGKWAGYAAAIAVMLLSAASTAQGQAVTFSQIRDAVPSKFFDPDQTIPNAGDPNQLHIGFHSGFDQKTFTTRDFRASTLPFSIRSVMDTISFMVSAPAGYYISKISYTQAGLASLSRTAVQGGAAEWVVADFPSSLGVFSSNPNLVGTADLTGLMLRSVPVSITVSLYAAATGSVAITSADVQAEVQALPAPPTPDLPPSANVPSADVPVEAPSVPAVPSTIAPVEAAPAPAAPSTIVAPVEAAPAPAAPSTIVAPVEAAPAPAAPSTIVAPVEAMPAPAGTSGA